MTAHEKIIMTLASYIKEKDMEKVLNKLNHNETLILMNICFSVLDLGDNIAYPVSELATKDDLEKLSKVKNVNELKEHIKNILPKDNKKGE